MIDFAFTFYGINDLSVIEEANPVWVAVFSMPLWLSTILRIAYFFGIIFLPCQYIKKRKPERYRLLLGIGYIAYSLMIVLHVRWMILI